jgi:hypothetical protein
MKITKSQLKQLIKEELQVIQEIGPLEGTPTELAQKMSNQALGLNYTMYEIYQMLNDRGDKLAPTALELYEKVNDLGTELYLKIYERIFDDAGIPKP